MGNSVEVKGGGVKGTLIAGNLIGLDATGTLRRGNAAGVLLNNVSGVVVGGATEALRNLILGSYAGVFIDDGHSNKVLGNFIGTDITGRVGIGSGSGVLLADGTFNNDIGGSLPGQGNLISGNGGAGVYLDASGPLNTVAGNVIGLDLAGLPLPNGEGVDLTFGSTHNIIGGKKPGAGNVISGNTSDGVNISGAGTDDNEVLGNFIGTDKLNSPGPATARTASISRPARK
jgi:titin